MSIIRTAIAAVMPMVIVLGAQAQLTPSMWQGVPAQIIPQVAEVGAPTFSTPTGLASFFGNTGTAGGLSSGGLDGGNGTSITGDGGSSYQNLTAQSYGSTAISTAQQLGNNPNAIAAFGQLESGFKNVPTANGSSSATGPWQITGPTWNDFISKYNLPYTAADRTNPDAQAVVSNYIMKDYGSQVSNSIGAPATVQQVYGAYVFGPQAGERLAAATDPSAPMSNYISATGLANNNMTGWTVGQFQNRVTSKVGSVASQTVQG